MNIKDLLKKSSNKEGFTKEELAFMLSLPEDSLGSYAIMHEANRIAKALSGNKAEVHAQFALNISRCACNCQFCSFAASNEIFKEDSNIGVESAIKSAQLFESNGANAIFVMATADYPLAKYLEVSREVRKNLKSETVLIANVGDQTLKNAIKIKDCGYAGVYHALRLREGRDTNLSPEKRKESIRNFQEAGLIVGTCVEPIGPEHTDEELAEMILYTASIAPAYSGAARRITIPNSSLAKYGMISELRMAKIVAVTRLGIPRETAGNCTHEPCTLGALAGANLFWAETGANPRDIKEKTENGRGGTVEHCRKLFWETNWDVLTGPSVFYRQRPPKINEAFNYPAGLSAGPL
ncbi:MAG: radical SAM protein [Elusimicrobia bacterium]|nr:radical SAM protein [Candidatus Liberimonas magnetica]